VRPARRLKVVVDAGNGVAGTYAPELLRRLGCEVVELFCESDGRFPTTCPTRGPRDDARPPGEGAGGGRRPRIAYDGDADRVGVVDERGAATRRT